MGITAPPNYNEYRRLSQDMFRILEEYSPTLVPISIDEGFLDLTTMDRHVWRHSSAAEYVQEICSRILREVKLPVSAGLASSSRLGQAGDVMPRSRASSKSRRAARRNSWRAAACGSFQALAKTGSAAICALGARTFGEAAQLPSTLLKQKFGIWGQQLWLVANGRWNEPVAAGGEGPHDDFEQYHAPLHMSQTMKRR